MAYFLWFWRVISPIITIAAIIYVAFGDLSPIVLVLGGVTGVIGLVLGFLAWGYDVPPRWFWVKSLSELAGSRVLSALSYMLQFALLPAGIMGIVMVVEELL